MAHRRGLAIAALTLLSSTAALADIQLQVDRWLIDGTSARVFLTVTSREPEPVNVQISCAAEKGLARLAFEEILVRALQPRESRSEDVLIRLHGAVPDRVDCTARY